MGLFGAIGGLLGGGAGGAIGGIVDGLFGEDEASNASAQQAQMSAEQRALYKLQADMGQHFFDSYKNDYEPLALSQLGAAKTGVDPAYYAAMADSSVVANQQRALEQAQRNMQRQGVSPSDGRWMAMQNQNALALSGNRVAGQNQARQNALDLNWNRRQQQVDYGAGLVGKGQSLAGSAAAGYGGLSNMYGQQAQSAGQYAGYNFDQAANGLVDWYRNGNSGGASGGNGGWGGLIGGLSGMFR